MVPLVFSPLASAFAITPFLAASLFDIIANATYLALALVALWGIYCIVLVWTRVDQKRFSDEDAQDAYLDEIEPLLASGEFDAALQQCEGDSRAIPQMVELAILNRELGIKRARQVMTDRFQRDVLSDLEYRLSWVGTVIKSAPMIGLFGTVFGMMGAFETLASAGSESLDPAKLAGDIRVALVTTASGLAIAIPLMILVANVNIKIAKMEDLISSGITRVFEAFKLGLTKESR